MTSNFQISKTPCIYKKKGENFVNQIQKHNRDASLVGMPFRVAESYKRNKKLTKCELMQV